MSLNRDAVVTAWNPRAIEAFDRSGDELCVVERPAVADLTGPFASARLHTYRSRVGDADASRHAVASLTGMGLDCPAVAEDIAALVRSFLAQFQLAEVDVRVQLTDRTSCPKFHCDNVRLRLVTTYCGPTTEYIRVAAPQRIHTAPAFALLFLKGAKHPGFADAVLHRSPAMPPGARRLCVALDV